MKKDSRAKHGGRKEGQRGLYPLIEIVDDDESVREALQSLFKSIGFGVEAFASAEDFLNAAHVHDPTCVILDVRMPGMDGLALQRQLALTECRIPHIFISAQEDEDVRARALQAGAVDFLSKPFSEEVLLNAVHAALDEDGERA